MIIDTETHIIYRMFIKEANPEKSLVNPWTWHELGGDLLIAEMDRAHVDKAFLISYGVDDLRLFMKKMGMETEDIVTGKKYTRSFYKKYPERFYWFTTIPDPRREDTIEVLKKDFQDGAIGIKIFPAMLDMNLNDPKLMGIYEFVRDQEKLIIIGIDESTLSQAQRLIRQLDTDVLNTFSDLHFQLNHAGCIDPLLPEAKIVFDMAKNHDNVFLSTALLGYIYPPDDEHEYPFPNQLRRLRKLYDEIGINKLMFATDWPWSEYCRKYNQDVDAIRRHCDFIKDEEKEKFLGQNALKYLGKCA